MQFSDDQKDTANIIVRNFGGIHYPREIAYISQVKSLSLQAVSAYEEFHECANAGASEEINAKLIGLLQTVLLNTASISRYFWPAPHPSGPNEIKELHKERGKKLVRAFNVTQNSALFDRRLRNAFEHFDEKLDIYHLAPSEGSVKEIIINRKPNEQALFAYFEVNTQSKKVWILGEEYSYSGIVEELRRINESADSFISNGWRLPTTD